MTGLPGAFQLAPIVLQADSLSFISSGAAPRTPSPVTDAAIITTDEAAVEESLRESAPERSAPLAAPIPAPASTSALFFGQLPVLIAPVAAPAQITATPTIVINEVLGSTTSTDVEYIELFGDAGASLAGLSLLIVESDDGGSTGNYDRRLDFTASDALGNNGFLLIGNSLVEGAYGVAPDISVANNFVENSAYTVALVETASLTGNSVAGGEVVLDAVGVADARGTNTFAFGAPVLGPDGNFLPAGVQRIVDGVDTDTAADWRLLDFFLGAPNDPNASAQPLVINEVLGSTTGSDSEYIELLGEAGRSLDGLSLLIVESDDGASNGNYDRRIDFTAADVLGENGYLLLANGIAETTYGVTANISISNNFIENSAYTVALVETASLTGNSVAGGEVVLDSVGVADARGTNTFAFGAPVLGPDGNFLPAGVQRIVDGVDTDTAADWRLLDFFNGAPNDPTPGTFSGPVGGDIDDTPTLISAIQGTEDLNAKNGEIVVVEGIVTGDFQNGDADDFRNLGGFFLMEEAGDRDASDLTSEGVFIAEGGPTALDVSAGDKVRVLGFVDERGGKTVVVANEIRIETAGEVSDLEAFAVDFALPDVANREAIESMLVDFTDDFTFVESFSVEAEGEILLSTIGEVQQFSQINTPDAAANATYLQNVADSTVTLDDGTEGARANGEPILKPDGTPFTLADGLRMGQTVKPLTAIADVSGGEMKLRLPGFESFETDIDSNPRPLTPDDVGGSLRVGSFNVLNYFTTLNERGAESPEELMRQEQKLVSAFLGMDADIIGLIELENNGGVAIDSLVAVLNASFTDRTYAAVDTGLVGTDAITNGFIYDTQTVELVGAHAVLDSVAFVAPLTGGSNNRPAIAQTFREIDSGGEFTAVVNHLKSKGSLTGAPADEDQGDGQGRNNATRTEAAKELARWLDTDPTGSDDGDFMILGDLNSYALEDPVTVLRDAGYVNTKAPDLTDEQLSQNSYRFSGQIGTLDYALANNPLFAQVTGATSWNINADEMFIHDYNLDSTFGASTDRPVAQGLFDGSNPAKNSDHDPIIVGLDLEQDALILITGEPSGGVMAGGDADELFRPTGGRNTIITGDGEDVIEIGDNPGRSFNIVNDFDVAKDSLEFTAALTPSVIRGGGWGATVRFDNGDAWLFRGLDADELRAALEPDMMM